MTLVRMEADGTGRVLSRYGYDANGLFLQRDTDGDGIIKDTDLSEPVLEADGKPITERLFDGGFFNTDTRKNQPGLHPRTGDDGRSHVRY